MKARFLTILFTVFAISISSMPSVHAKAVAPRTPHAYYVAEFTPSPDNPDGIKPYSAKVESTFTPFGGRFIVRGGQVTGLEGEAPTARMIVIEFDSMERALAWYHSPAYEALKPVRHRSGTSRVYLLEGTPR